MGASDVSVFRLFMIGVFAVVVVVAAAIIAAVKIFLMLQNYAVELGCILPLLRICLPYLLMIINHSKI